MPAGKYTLQLSDAGKVIAMDYSTSCEVIVPKNSSVAFPIGTQIEVFQKGAGQVNITYGIPEVGNPTIYAPNGRTVTAAQHSRLRLLKIASNDWLVTPAEPGDVVGPGSAADGRIALFDGVTGKVLKVASESVGDILSRANHTGTQAISTVSGLQGALDGKAGSSHTHAIADVTGLQTALDSKAPTASLGTMAEQDASAVNISGGMITDVFLDVVDDSFTLKQGDKWATFSCNLIPEGTGKGYLLPPETTVLVGTGVAQSLSNKTLGNSNTITLKDANFTLQDDADTTKQAQFQLSGISTGSTRVFTFPDANATLVGAATSQTLTNKTIAFGSNTVTGLPTEFGIAVSDETTAITTGTAKVTFRMPYAMTLSSVRANLNTASSSGTPTIDINLNGSSILSTKLTVDASEKTSVTAATPAVISNASLTDDAEITVDIDTAGTGAKGLKIWLIGVRA